MSKKEASVVICSHRRVDLLKGAIKSLENQNVFSNNYEVIVVDNDIEENNEIKRVVEEASNKISIRYIYEKKIGLSYARNTGAKRALSDYVCYLDDDAKANSNYIKTLVHVINQYEPDICGGPYFPFYLDAKPKWYLDLYGSRSLGNRARFLKPNEYLNGTNIVFRKDILQSLGWFNTDLGMHGSKLSYGEETKLMIDAWKNNPKLKVYYDPNLSVHHLVPAWKMRILNIVRISFQMGNSQAYFWGSEFRYNAVRTSAPLSFVFIIASLVFKIFQGIFLRNHRRYPYFQNYIVEELTKYITSLGVHFRITKDLLLFSRSFK